LVSPALDRDVRFWHLADIPMSSLAGIRSEKAALSEPPQKLLWPSDV
jgi:hypothetical protein